MMNYKRYLMVLGQYLTVLAGTLSVLGGTGSARQGLYACMYILEKVKIWSGVTDA